MSKTEQDHYASQYGTDKQFLEWITWQPSVIDGGWNQYDPSRNLPCHVRRLEAGSGMGHKPPFSAVPMTHTQHIIQSGKNGEAEVLRIFLKQPFTDEEASSWFENKRDEMVANWINSRRHKWA